MRISQNVCRYIEKLHYEEFATKRTVAIAEKLEMPLKIIEELQRKSLIADIKFNESKQILLKEIRKTKPLAKCFVLDYGKSEVTIYEEN